MPGIPLALTESHRKREGAREQRRRRRKKRGRAVYMEQRGDSGRGTTWRQNVPW